MEVVVRTINGEDTGRKVKLNHDVFDIEPNDHAIYLDAKQFMANQRQGTHDTRERNAVAGSTKKIKRQKGTGTARFGDIKNPIFRGGGRIFGPQPRSYRFKLNKKTKQLARKSALTYKARENGLLILEDFNFEKPRTKDYVAMLKHLEVDDKRTLLVVKETDQNLVLSSRNLKKTKVLRACDINTYDILRAQHVLLQEGSLDAINEMFNNQ